MENETRFLQKQGSEPNSLGSEHFQMDSNGNIIIKKGALKVHSKEDPVFPAEDTMIAVTVNID